MSSTASTIYTGFWINWSYGRVHGSTVTLSAVNSAFLIAFIALFVRLVGGQLWAVLAFLASVTRSTAGPQDALYHQQQAVLRNTSEPATILWAMVKLSWFWKGTARRVKTRTFAFVFTLLAYIAAFAVAGIFSSRISSANSEVLLLPSRGCGFWHYPYLSLFDQAKESWQDYSIQRTSYWADSEVLTKKSHSYVSECYNTTLDNPNDSCLPFGKSRISWSTNLHAACPFDDEMCIADAVQFDTGFLNSHTHFGINTRHDRIEYRRVMTCAPITTDGYVSDYVNASGLGLSAVAADSGTVPFEDETFLKYAYGQSILFDDNTTFAFSNLSWGVSVGEDYPFNIYDLDVEVSVAAPDDPETLTASSFVAIPSLSRPDVDTTLIFLSLNGSYLSEVRDPWFRSTVRYTDLGFGASPGTTYYTRDAANAVVACAEQHQLRNPITGATSRLGGAEVVTNAEAQRLGFNDNQMSIFNRSFVFASYGVLGTVVPYLGGSYLLAAASQAFRVSTGLPDNQWQLEVNHWFGVALNTIQLWSQQYIVGPSRPQMDHYIVPATEGFAQQMCTNQISRRTNYRSFNVLGMAIIFAFGLLFIIANFTIRSIVEKVQGHTPKGRYRNAEWQANDFLQLQRMAYQHNNVGTWTGQHDMVPRTNPGDVFTLPESTNWNQGVPEILQKDRKRLFRSLSRGWSHEAKKPASPITDPNTSGSSMDNEPAISTIDVEKGIHTEVTVSDIS